MKRIRLLIIMIILTIVLGVYAVQPVAAVPQLPSSFWGSVTLDGSPVPAGTAISARINGDEYGHTTTILDSGTAYYTLDVIAEDTETGTPGGKNGDTILFFIGSYQEPPSRDFRGRHHAQVGFSRQHLNAYLHAHSHRHQHLHAYGE